MSDDEKMDRLMEVHAAKASKLRAGDPLVVKPLRQLVPAPARSVRVA